LWGRRRWRYLLNLIDHLPRQSFFVEALMGDDEVAAGVEDADVPAAVGERLSEWGPEREGLAQLLDAVRALHYTVRAALGANDQPPTPVGRPQTAAQRRQRSVAWRQHQELKRRLRIVDPAPVVDGPGG
jgi:hypothetical protein